MVQNICVSPCVCKSLSMWFNVFVCVCFWLCICVFLSVCLNISVCVFECFCLCICMFLPVCLNVSVHVFEYFCRCVWMFLSVCLNISVSVFECFCLCVSMFAFVFSSCTYNLLLHLTKFVDCRLSRDQITKLIDIKSGSIAQIWCRPLFGRRLAFEWTAFSVLWSSS